MDLKVINMSICLFYRRKEMKTDEIRRSPVILILDKVIDARGFQKFTAEFLVRPSTSVSKISIIVISTRLGFSPLYTAFEQVLTIKRDSPIRWLCLFDRDTIYENLIWMSRAGVKPEKHLTLTRNLAS